MFRPVLDVQYRPECFIQLRRGADLDEKIL